MSNIKFYTEEELLKAIQYGRDYYDVWVMTEPEILKQLTPIELPSEHEIEESSFKMSGNNVSPSSNFMIGAYWMKEQILNQNI